MVAFSYYILAPKKTQIQTDMYAFGEWNFFDIFDNSFACTNSMDFLFKFTLQTWEVGCLSSIAKSDILLPLKERACISLLLKTRIAKGLAA